MHNTLAADLWPEALRDDVGARLQRLDERLRDAGAEALRTRLATADLADELRQVALASDYALSWIGGHPEAFAAALDAGWHRQRPDPVELRRDLAGRIAALPAGPRETPDGPLGRLLRVFRNQHQVGLIWRDVCGHADLQATVTDLSALADAILIETLHALEAQAISRWGTPEGAGGAGGPGGSRPADSDIPQRLLVLAMGKLGASELNLSSDIDLIFVHDTPGTTRAPASVGVLSHQEFFLRLARWLVGVLDARTAEGFVFRVDARLRPFGDSGALVLHRQALLDYYEEQGRDWERYAMVKMRVVTGDEAVAAELADELRPFVYRRYLDFGAIAALREMKDMIRREVHRRQLQDDIKLGAGGIREVEFIAQVFQLIHGGRDPQLQQRALRPILQHLARAGLLGAAEVASLETAYVFLRCVEHRLQMFQDEQTQQLPRDAVAMARLACSLGFADSAAFRGELQRHRDAVVAIFNGLIAAPDADRSAADLDALSQWQALWEDPSDDEQAREQLLAAGFQAPPAVLASLTALRERALREVTQAIARQRLDALLPRLLLAAAQHEAPDRAVLGVAPLLDAVLRRTAYLVLLLENPDALDRLLTLCAASALISEHLARHPILLDEMLDGGALYRAPDRAGLAAELLDELRGVEADDLELQMEQLRYFKEATELRVAACEITGSLPLMQVSDALTWLAEVIVEQAAYIAWHATVAQYGRPRREDGTASEGDFLVLGYGKLGGLELGWGSDLDLVFLHDTPLTGTTDGAREVVNGQFFSRFGQRVIHLLTTRTHTGALYDVDIRLRPSGRAGLMVTSVEAFERYQLEDAWVWEHQALVRARPVAGSAALAERFEGIRAGILRAPRERAELRDSVVSMRARMLAELGGLSERPPLQELARRDAVALKQAPGGIVDIEFMVQYLVLAWAREYPDLVRFSDNIRILEVAGQVGVLAAEEAEFLIESYRELRAEAHRKALQNQPALTQRPELLDRAARIAALWDVLMQPC